MITTPTQIQPSPVVVALLNQPAVFATVQNDDPNSGPAIAADIDRVIALGRVARPTKEQLHSFILESGELLEPPKDFDTESGNNKIEDFHSAGCLVISDKKRSGYTALAITAMVCRVAKKRQQIKRSWIPLCVRRLKKRR